jgi:hypothetical protein
VIIHLINPPMIPERKELVFHGSILFCFRNCNLRAIYLRLHVRHFNR